MRVLITAGTGKVGRELTKRIYGRGHDPIVMTHSLSHLKDLPSGVEGIFTDLQRKESWEESLKNIDKLCLITPCLQNEGEIGKEFAQLAIGHGIQQIVFLSIYNVEAGVHIPHFAAKIEIEEMIKRSGTPYTFIRANNFFQNDEWFVHGVEEQGMYTQPLGPVGLNRVDVRDVADAIVNALLDTKHHFKTYPLLGKEALTGRKTAAIYSEVVGNKISYPENSLQIWETNFKNHIPDWQLEDWKMMYEFFLQDGLLARGDDFERLDQILGKSPRRFEDYVKELLGKTTTHYNHFGDWTSRTRKSDLNPST